MEPSPTSTTGRSRAPSRIVIDGVAPLVADGRFPVKRIVGEPVVAEATVYADGHDLLYTVLSHRPPGRTSWTDVAMEHVNPGLDRWRATFTPAEQGLHRFRVIAWVDHFASWRQATARKLEAGQEVRSDLVVGAALLERAAADLNHRDATPYRRAAERLRRGEAIDVTDPGGERRPSAADLYRRRLRKVDAQVSTTVDVLVERERALFSTWYELFPRSWSPDRGSSTHGTLVDVADQIDYVADLGFDVLYLPPIHPIGHSHRKGPDNAERAGPGDPGSPWAIGSEEGGHTAVHPALGSVDDLRRLVKVAGENGIEIALDIAFQCSPDHPWVAEHPEWFVRRPDGTIQHAENPPKRYQDIYPLDFESPAWESLWRELRDVFAYWMEQGVRVFRVDNPHTKPFAFWEWVLADLRSDDPDLIFLCEAFTRPEVMHRLAQLGFTQSYTYFTWRITKGELTDYFTELSTAPSVDELRPNAWPNTPDILAWHLQDAPPTMNAVRLFLAATLSPSYGIYGPAFELADNRPARNGKEEYAESEKYQIRNWDRSDPRSIKDLVGTLNRIRHAHLALRTLRTLQFHSIDNEQLLAYSKVPHEGPDLAPDHPERNPVLCVANLDPVRPQAAEVIFDSSGLGLDPTRSYAVHDLLTDRTFEWSGERNYVELHPDSQPGHLFRVSQS
jgi:starch synthase (maltosyl-transferring)